MIKNEEIIPNIRTIRELIASEKDTYIMYQYGPFLAMYNTEIFEEYYDEIKHPLMRYFVDMAKIVRLVTAFLTTPHSIITKKKLINIINEASTHTDRYADLVVKHGTNILHVIIEESKKCQREKGIGIESTILNCAPIVPYCGVIVKSEIADLYQGNMIDPDDLYQTRRALDQVIEDSLQNHIVEILSHYGAYMIADDIQLSHAIANFHEMKDSDPQKEVLRYVLNYRIAVYAKFNESLDAKKLFKIISDSNTICNGGRINVSEMLSHIIQQDA